MHTCVINTMSLRHVSALTYPSSGSKIHFDCNVNSFCWSCLKMTGSFLRCDEEPATKGDNIKWKQATPSYSQCKNQWKVQCSIAYTKETTLLILHTHNYVCVLMLNDLTVYVYSRLILTLRRLMSYIYGAPILDVSRSHTTTQHSR